MLLPNIGRIVGPGIECRKEVSFSLSVFPSSPSSKLSLLIRWIVALIWMNCLMRYLSWCRISANSFRIHKIAASRRASLSSLVPSESITGTESALGISISTSFADPDFKIFHVHTFIYGKEWRLASWSRSSSISEYFTKKVSSAKNRWISKFCRTELCILRRVVK